MIVAPVSGSAPVGSNEGGVGLGGVGTAPDAGIVVGLDATGRAGAVLTGVVLDGVVSGGDGSVGPVGGVAYDGPPTLIAAPAGWFPDNVIER